MSDLLGLAFDVVAIGLGLFLIGYMLWQVSVYRQRSGALSPRAARIWRWRIVSGLCGGIAAICFGGEQFLPQVGVSGFGWLIVAGLFATVGLLAAMLMVANLEDGTGHAQRREPEDDTR